MKRSIKKPTKGIFPYPGFRRIYNKTLVNLLADYMGLYKNTIKELGENMEYYKGVIDKSRFRDLKTCIEEDLAGFHLMTSSRQKGKDLFYGLFGKKGYSLDPEICELCGDYFGRLQKHHNVPREFFKKNKMGMKAYDEAKFENHLLNIIILCPNCHSAIDEPSLISKRKADILIRRRLKVNKKSKEILRKDIEFLKDMYNDLYNFDEDFGANATKFMEEYFGL